MATASLTSLLTDIILVDDGSLTGLGTSNSEFVETVLNRQGVNCGSNGHNGTLGPTVPSNPNEFCGSFWGVTQNLTNLHLHVWLRGIYPLRSKTLGGLSIYVGDGTNTGLWYISGSDSGYSGNWLHGVVDCSKAFDLDSGISPNLASITEIGGCYNISATKGADILYPFFFDAIRKENGSGQNGIRIVGGTIGDRLLFSDLPIGDETLRTGIAEVERDNIFCGGEWHFGNAASTMYLQDDDVTVNAANLPVASDYYKIIFNDGTIGITDFRVSKLTWNGISRAVPCSYDTSALGAGDTHDCPDETFNFFSIIKFGPQTTKLRPVFNESVTIIPNGIVLTNPIFNNCDAITLTAVNDAITNGTVKGHNTLTGVAFINTDNPTKISTTSFDINSGVGHAVSCNTIGVFDWIGNTDIGYTGVRGTNLVSASGSTDAMFFNESGGLIELNVSGGGQSPSIRNGAGATTQVNATVNITFDKMKDNTEVWVYQAGTFNLISGGYIEDAISGTINNRSFTWSISAGTSVDYQLINSFSGEAVYENIYVKGFSVPTSDTTIDIAQRLDRNAA